MNYFPFKLVLSHFHYFFLQVSKFCEITHSNASDVDASDAIAVVVPT